MASSYPGSLDSFGAPAGTDSQSTPVGGRTHSQSHTDLGDAVEAIETELGVNPSGGSATVVARLDALDTTVAGKEATGVAAALVDDLSGVTNAATARSNLGLGDSATKNTGTTAGTVAAGDDSRIVGALPASLVDAKGDLLTATADNTPARLAVGAEGDVLTVRGSAASGLAWAQPQPRNLLTVNQSSVETDTTGLAAYYNATIARSTAQAAAGSASLLVTATGSTPAASTSTGTSGAPVIPGRLYTAHVSVYGGTATGRTVSVGIRWYTAAGAAIGSLTTGTSVVLSAAWSSVWRFEVAPATAAYAAVVVNGSVSFVSTEDFYVDRLMLVEGYGGTWSLGGQPVQGIGERWDESVGRRCFRWDWNNSREQMVYGDTGWRDVSASFNSPWTGAWRIRRIGYTIFHDVYNVAGGTGAVWTAPSGFRVGRAAGDAQTIPVARYDLASHSAIGCNSGGAGNYTVLGGAIGYAGAVLQGSGTTPDAWPSSLPGTASGSIPTA